MRHELQLNVTWVNLWSGSFSLCLDGGKHLLRLGSEGEGGSGGVLRYNNDGDEQSPIWGLKFAIRELFLDTCNRKNQIYTRVNRTDLNYAKTFPRSTDQTPQTLTQKNVTLKVFILCFFNYNKAKIGRKTIK